MTHQAKLCSFEAQIIWEDVPNNLISEVDSEAHTVFFVHIVPRHLAYIVAKITGEEGNFPGYSLRQLAVAIYFGLRTRTCNLNKHHDKDSFRM